MEAADLNETSVLM